MIEEHHSEYFRRYFLLRKTYFDCNGVYPRANIRGKFIRCISCEFQFSGVSGVSDSDTWMEIEGKGQDAGDRHPAFISSACVGFGGALPDVFSWFGDCAGDCVFNWSRQRSAAFYYMVRNKPFFHKESLIKETGFFIFRKRFF